MGKKARTRRWLRDFFRRLLQPTTMPPSPKSYQAAIDPDLQAAGAAIPINQAGVVPGEFKLQQFRLACQLAGLRQGCDYADYPKDRDPILKLKFFDPQGSWTWYAIAWSIKSEDIVFGYVEGFENELGDFSLRELAELKQRGGDVYLNNQRIGRMPGIGIEIDNWFRPVALSVHQKKQGGEDVRPGDNFAGPVSDPAQRSAIARRIDDLPVHDPSAAAPTASGPHPGEVYAGVETVAPPPAPDLPPPDDDIGFLLGSDDAEPAAPPTGPDVVARFAAGVDQERIAQLPPAQVDDIAHLLRHLDL